MATNMGQFPLPWTDSPKTTIIPFDMAKGVGIGAKTKNVESCKAFLNYYTSDDVLTTYFTSEGTVPSYSGLKVKLGPGISDMAAALTKYGTGKIFVQYIFKDGLNPWYDGAAAGSNTKSLETILKEVQDQFEKSGKDNKVPGF
jgi:hypothetical protein